MKKLLAAIAIALGTPLATAASASLTYSNLRFEVVDLAPDDGASAWATGVPFGPPVAWTNFLDTYQPASALSEIPGSIEWTGMLAPHSEIRWGTDTAIDVSIVDDPFGIESVHIEYMSYSFFEEEYFDGYGWSGIPGFDLVSSNGTFETLTYFSASAMGAVLSNHWDVAVPFRIGIATDFYVSGLDRPPIPEPSTYALLLSGLAALGIAAHRRSSADRPKD